MPTKSLILGYVRGCLNSDGGYAFCAGLQSNVQDTFFALALLDMLESGDQGSPRTVEWLKAFPADDLRSHYYVNRSLALLGEDLSKNRNAASALLGSIRLDQTPVALSEFEALAMLAHLKRLLRLDGDPRTVQVLLRFQNNDGGCGQRGHSSILATYHAVSALADLGYDLSNIRNVLGFTRACEDPQGGFTLVPNSGLPFIEETHAGIMILGAFNENVRNPQGCIRRIGGSLSSRGGFFRAEFGIPTLANTYYATAALMALGYF